MKDNEEREEHPSFGMIGFSRCTGNPGRLFGSPLRTHESFVTLRLARGVRIHSLGYDRYYGPIRGDVVEVILSAGQFSELLTTMNIGSGVPCTITYADGEKVPRPPEDQELEVEKVRKNFKRDLGGVVDQMKEGKKELATLLEKKTLTKHDREQIMAIIVRVQMHVESNMPFMLDQFEEASEKVVKHAKAEIDAFVTGNVVAEGLKAIQTRIENQAPQLPEKSDNDE